MPEEEHHNTGTKGITPLHMYITGIAPQKNITIPRE